MRAWCVDLLRDHIICAVRHTHFSALRIYVTVYIETVGKLIVNRCHYRQQPCSVSFLCASQQPRRYDVPGKCNNDYDGMQKRASLYHISIHCQVESSRSFHMIVATYSSSSTSWAGRKPSIDARTHYHSYHSSVPVSGSTTL